jgi:hypothetical protein
MYYDKESVGGACISEDDRLDMLKVIVAQLNNQNLPFAAKKTRSHSVPIQLGESGSIRLLPVSHPGVGVGHLRGIGDDPVNGQARADSGILGLSRY